MALQVARHLVAQRSALQIIGVVGTLAAGKTEVGQRLAYELYHRGYRQNEVAYVVNEAGGTSLFDSPYATVITLPSGCFTCTDEADLQVVLEELQNRGFKVVIQEGFGLVSGDEVAEFLQKSGYSYQIVAVLDTSMLSLNKLRYGVEIMTSHVQVASAVLLNKVKRTTNRRAQAIQRAEAFVMAHARDVPIELFRQNQLRLPVSIVEAALNPRFISSVYSHHCGPLCRHPEHHHEAHARDQTLSHGGKRTFALTVRDGVTVADLKRVFGEILHPGVLRVKGVVNAVSVNAEPDNPDWAEKPSNMPSFLVVYLDEAKSRVSDLDGLAELCSEPPRLARSYELLRIDTDPVTTSREIACLVDDISTKSVTFPNTGGLITHPEEMQLVQQMARRPLLAGEWKERVYTECLKYWVECVALLSANYDTLKQRPELSTNERELGVSLAWWATEYAATLPSELKRAVREAKPAVLVARGLMALKQLRQDEFWRYWQIEELKRALAYPGDLTSEETALIEEAKVYLKRLEAQLITVV